MANLSNINGKFVVEQTTGYVGVGTTDPNYPIEVLNASAEIALNASGGSIYRLQSDSASNFIIRKAGVGDRLVINSAGNSTFAGNITFGDSHFIGDDASDNLLIQSSAGENIIIDSLDETLFRINGSTKMQIKSSGNVGIGTTSPDTKLEVDGKSSYPIIKISASSNTSRAMSLGMTDAVTHFIDAGGSSSNLIFKTVGSERMRIDSSGNVNITGRYLSLTDSDYTYILGKRTSPSDGFYLTRLMGYGDNTFYGSFDVLRHDVNDGELRMRQLVAGTVTDVMTIVDGNVGIGTTNIGAQSNLYLGATSSSEGGQITLQKATGGTLAAHIDAYTSGSIDYMRVLSGTDTTTTAAPFVFDLTNTRLGIGTTSPSKKLHVVGDQLIFGDLLLEGSANSFRTVSMNTVDGSDNQTLSLCGGATSSSARGGRVDIQGNEVSSTGGTVKIVAGNVSTGDIELYTANTSRIKINNAGNVGIGETTPATKLHVKHPAAINDAYGLVLIENTNTGTSGPTNSAVNVKNKFGTSQFMQWENKGVRIGSRILDNGGTGDIIFTAGSDQEKMRITSTGAISVGSSGTAYGAAGEVLTSNGNASPSWQAAGGGGSAWPQEKFAVYTINSTTSNILIATMNSTTWHGDQFGGCLKFTINDTNYIQVSYVTIYTFLSGTNKWFFKGNTEMTTHNNGTNPIRYVFAFAGAYGSFGPTTTLKINRVSSGPSNPVNVLVQAISSPDMFILN